MTRRKGGVAKVDVDDKEGNEREYHVAAQSAKATIGIKRPDNAV